jgi:hypothetical protein
VITPVTHYHTGRWVVRKQTIVSASVFSGIVARVVIATTRSMWVGSELCRWWRFGTLVLSPVTRSRVTELERRQR